MSNQPNYQVAELSSKLAKKMSLKSSEVEKPNGMSKRTSINGTSPDTEPVSRTKASKK